jgi:hypothetical protein
VGLGTCREWVQLPYSYPLLQCIKSDNSFCNPHFAVSVLMTKLEHSKSLVTDILNGIPGGILYNWKKNYLTDPAGVLSSWNGMSDPCGGTWRLVLCDTTGHVSRV